MTHEIMHESNFASESITLANNIVAISHLFEYNKYQISTFLLEPLEKKVCSVSFVSQYILVRSFMA